MTFPPESMLDCMSSAAAIVVPGVYLESVLTSLPAGFFIFWLGDRSAGPRRTRSIARSHRREGEGIFGIGLHAGLNPFLRVQVHRSRFRITLSSNPYSPHRKAYVCYHMYLPDRRPPKQTRVRKAVERLLTFLPPEHCV